MSRKRIPAPFFDYRRKFSTPTVLYRLGVVAKEWGMKFPEVCSKLIHEGLLSEVKKIDGKAEEMEEFKRINKNNG